MATTTTHTHAYCVKCHASRAIKDAQPVTLKNGASALQGTCPVCGTKLTRILPKAQKVETSSPGQARPEQVGEPGF